MIGAALLLIAVVMLWAALIFWAFLDGFWRGFCAERHRIIAERSRRES